PGGVTLRISPWNRALDATPHEAFLLQGFDRPQRIEEVIAADPFMKEEVTTFLARCVSEGFLPGEGDEGPLTTEPLVRFAHSPRVDPAAPADFVVVGVPWDKDTTGRPGARFGPATIRDGAAGAHYQVEPLSLRPL